MIIVHEITNTFAPDSELAMQFISFSMNAQVIQFVEGHSRSGWIRQKVPILLVT